MYLCRRTGHVQTRVHAVDRVVKGKNSSSSCRVGCNAYSRSQMTGFDTIYLDLSIKKLSNNAFELMSHINRVLI